MPSFQNHLTLNIHCKDYFVLFLNNGLVPPDSHHQLAQFLKTSPETFWEEIKGKSCHPSDHLFITFDKLFHLSAKHGYANNMVFFIVEKTTDQVLFSYYPHSYNSIDDALCESGLYMHEAFQPAYPKRCAETQLKIDSDPSNDYLFPVYHKRTIIRLYFSDRLQEFTSKFDSKYPL